MALLQETFTETLDAGAPSIKYEGDIQQEQKIARTLWDQLPNQVRMRFGSFEQFFQSGAWKKVLEAVQQQQQMEAPEQIQETEVVQEQAPQQGLGSMMPAPMAGGGIAGIRQPYFLGKLVKKITKPIKKIWKSPVGKAVALAGLGSWGLGMGPLGDVAGAGWMKGPMMDKLLKKGTYDEALKKTIYEGYSPLKIAGIGATLAPFAMAGAGKWDTGEQAIDKITGGDWDFDYASMRKEIADAALTGDQDKMNLVLAKYNLSPGDMPGQEYWKTAAEGGRIGYDDGGISTMMADLDAVKDGYSELIFGKPVHELTPEELIELEIILKDKLGGPFSKKEMAPEGVMTAAQGGRIGYAEGGWEAREKQDLISRLVRMGLPLPQAIKMAEMIIANATPQELQRTLSGTKGLTPIEATETIEEKITPDETITDYMSKVYPLPESVQAPKEYVSLSGAKPDMRAAMMGKARPSQALRDRMLDRMQRAPGEFLDRMQRAPGEFLDRMQRAPGEFKRRMQRAPYEVEVEEEISPYGAAEGGLMSLGGMEMDLRGGGFVPLGAKEKADDVPARLSKNEFVFTADAVRAAGGGDVDAGADKMYNTMKQLENRVGS